MIARLERDILDRRTYGRIAYLLLALPLGIVESTFLVTAISFGVGTAVTLIGIPVLIGTVYAWRWMAGVERSLIGALTGIHIPSPYRAEPAGASWWDGLKARLADPATWKDLLFLLLQLPLGIASFVIVVCVLCASLGSVLAPVYFWSVPDGIDLWLLEVDTLLEALALVPLGAVWIVLGIPALGALGRLYGELASLLLGSNVDPKLTAEVSDLRDARSRIIAAADAERRRIERDLHDGAQQRLVALALTLRMAEKRAADGDPDTAVLVRQAGDEAGLALDELRDLARGIHPAILTNRGLRAALDDLAARATLPVEIVAAPAERLPEPVEAAAYFVVSESLANVSKHAHATRAEVSVAVGEGRVTVTVGDDGVGGADPENGSGLQGLADRVGAVDGHLTVHSPPGEGTRVVATIPLAAPPVPVIDPLPPEAPRILPDDVAAERQRARVGRLRTRLAVLGGLGLVCVVVWALTSGGYFWPVWPLLGLGLVAGVDASRVLAGPPLRQSEVSDGREPRELRRRRRLRVEASALGVVNLFLIGVWLAAGGGYFWPVWPLLGSGVAVGLKALRWPAVVRDRLLDQAS
ncbi:MAG: sensor domain-containing protein [Thermoleophilaceae bacterium]|nr:sensor domain-containing protein [Thermoleophilaceae bacterium]